MIFCADIELRSVTAQRHVAPEEPGWPLTKLLCDGVELCNALEATEWHGDLVQVTRCTGCHHTGCADGGYVRVSRLGDDVLWTPPVLADDIEDWERQQLAARRSARESGAVLFPGRRWDELRQRPSCDGLPPREGLPVTTRAELAQAWLAETRGTRRLERLSALLPMVKDQLLACDTLTVTAAVAALARLVDWVGALPDAAVEGRFERADVALSRLETLYFEGPAADDWPAFAHVGDAGLALAFGRDWVFLLAQPL